MRFVFVIVFCFLIVGCKLNLENIKSKIKGAKVTAFEKTIKISDKTYKDFRKEHIELLGRITNEEDKKSLNNFIVVADQTKTLHDEAKGIYKSKIEALRKKYPKENSK